ncbi:mucin-2-like [Oppia nitens]|uniref:mucin-2-like n=1 Tax=Oppia nitens TaxID=1686743 RepID=UPI0023DBA9AC|nr:mucin-2-like [Oppia nitens]
MSETTDDLSFKIECSDDENYDNNENNYRVVNGKKVWEPTGADIARLYQQLEAKGFIELRWQCPGRRSPSVHNLAINNKPDVIDNDTNGSDNKSSLMNEFDFENDFNDDHNLLPMATKSGSQTKRRSTGIKKQTNLTKVMADIKKYHFVDQTKKLTIHSPKVQTDTIATTSTNVTALTASISLPTPTAPAPHTPTTSSPVLPMHSISPITIPSTVPSFSLSLPITFNESTPTSIPLSESPVKTPPLLSIDPIITTVTLPQVISTTDTTQSLSTTIFDNTTSGQFVSSIRSDSPTDILHEN